MSSLPLPEQRGPENEDFASRLASYRYRLISRAWSVLGSREAAEDVVQEVMLCAFRSRGGFKPSRGMSGWLFAILNNEIKNYYARYSRERLIGEVLASKIAEGENGWCVDPEELTINDDRSTRLHAAIQTLPPHLREAIHLFYFCGHEVSDLAERLGISTENAKVRLHRGRKALKGSMRVE